MLMIKFQTIAYCLLVLLFSSCEQGTYKLVEFDIEPKSAPIVLVSINGLEPVKLQIDTGASHSYLSDAYESAHTDTFTQDGTYSEKGNTLECVVEYSGKKVYATLNEEVKVKFYTADIRGLIDTFYNAYGIRIVGVIGSDILGEKNGVVDFRNNKLTLMEYVEG